MQFSVLLFRPDAELIAEHAPQDNVQVIGSFALWKQEFEPKDLQVLAGKCPQSGTSNLIVILGDVLENLHREVDALSHLYDHQIVTILGLRFSICDSSDSFLDIVGRSAINANRIDRRRAFYFGAEEEGKLVNITEEVQPMVADLGIAVDSAEHQFLIDTFKTVQDIPQTKVGTTFFKNPDISAPITFMLKDPNIFSVSLTGRSFSKSTAIGELHKIIHDVEHRDEHSRKEEKPAHPFQKFIGGNNVNNRRYSKR